MVAWTTGQGILTDLGYRNPNFNSGDPTRDRGYIQKAYYDFLLMHPWLFALKDPPGIINTLAEVTGTATTVTKGSATVTLSAVIAATMAGRKFYIDAEQIPYRILTHVAGTATLVLDATYKEVDVSSGAFTIFENEYTLATDCLTPWFFRFRDSASTPLDFLGRGEMDERFGTDVGNCDSVYHIALVKNNKVRIKPWTDEAQTIEYDYTARPDPLTFDSTATDTLVLPADVAPIIADLVLLSFYLDFGDAKAVNFSKDIDRRLNNIKDVYLAKLKPRVWIKAGRRL